VQQLTYVRKRRLEWREVPEPAVENPGEAVVRPVAAGRCDGDPVILNHDYTRAIKAGVAVHYLDPMVPSLLGPRPMAGPIAVGHESVGEVVAVGESVTAVAPGDTVVVPWSVSCGECPRCRAGLTSRCGAHPETLIAAYGFGPAMGDWGGAVSDRVRVPYADAMLVPVPDGVDPASVAAASDNVADGYRCVAPYLARWPGAHVLVVGGGARSIGLYAAGLAVALGAERVAYLDNSRERLDIAADLGAQPLELPASGAGRKRWLRRHAPTVGGDYPIVVDASATPPGLRYALRSLAPGGVCTSVGYYFAKGTALPLMQMYANDSTLHTGISHPRPDLPAILDLVAAGRFRPERVSTLVAEWDDAAEAFLEDTTKVVVRREGA
jgi:alcohol dehydrogenase